MCGYSPSPVFFEPTQEPFITMYGAPIPFKKKRPLWKVIIFVICALLGGLLLWVCKKTSPPVPPVLYGPNPEMQPDLYGPPPIEEFYEIDSVNTSKTSEQE